MGSRMRAREIRMLRNATCQKKLSFVDGTSSSSARATDASCSDGDSDSKQHRDSSLPELAIDLLFEHKGASRTMIRDEWPSAVRGGSQESKEIQSVRLNASGTKNRSDDSLEVEEREEQHHKDGSGLHSSDTERAGDGPATERKGSISSLLAVEDRGDEAVGVFADENCNTNSSNRLKSVRGMDPLAKALLDQTRAWEFFSPLLAKQTYGKHWVGTGEFATMEYTLAFVHGILYRAGVSAETDGLTPTLALTSLWLADIWATRSYELRSLMEFYMMFHPNRKNKDDMNAISDDMQKLQVELLRGAKWSIWLKEEDLFFSIGCLHSVPWYRRVVKYIEDQSRDVLGRKAPRLSSGTRLKREHVLSCKDGRGSFTLYTVTSDQLLPSAEKVLDKTVYSNGTKRRLEEARGAPIPKRQQSDADVNISWKDALRILYEHWRDYIRMMLHRTGRTRQPEK